MSYNSYCAGFDRHPIRAEMNPQDYNLGKEQIDAGYKDRWTLSEFNLRQPERPVKYKGEVYGDLTVSDYPESDTGAKREKLNTPSYDLVPFQEITDAFTRVAEFGAVKYEPWNWSKGLKRVQLLGSLLRHAFAYLRGQDRDKDSGLLHTDHILWNATALCHNVAHNLEDGRRKEPPRDYYEE